MQNRNSSSWRPPGGYELPLTGELYAAGLPVAVVNPKRIRDFAKAAEKTAKTDKIDARIIARFAAVMEPPVRNLQDDTSFEIRTLVVRKRQLTDMRTAEKNRMEHIRDEFIEESIRAVTDTIETQIRLIQERIRDLIASVPELKQKSELIQSVPGIGENTAAALVSGLPEIGTLNRREIAALTGTAPVNRDSGQFRGKRMTGGGRGEIRHLLYMPVLAAIRHNPVIRKYYQRLVSAGKIKMVAVTACMRKLIVIVNSMVAKNEVWRPKTS
ncbi:MAG: IS110 family transposase [Desulfococcaceae bacterium]